MVMCPRCGTESAEAAGAAGAGCGAACDTESAPGDATESAAGLQASGSHELTAEARRGVPGPVATPIGGAAPDRFRRGTLLAGRYLVESLLGQGGMGEVYRARDTKLGEVVAIKLLPQGAPDPMRLRLLIGEVRVAHQISHPNVCRIHHVDGVADQVAPGPRILAHPPGAFPAAVIAPCKHQQRRRRRPTEVQPGHPGGGKSKRQLRESGCVVVDLPAKARLIRIAEIEGVQRPATAALADDHRHRVTVINLDVAVTVPVQHQRDRLPIHAIEHRLQAISRALRQAALHGQQLRRYKGPGLTARFIA